MGYYCKTCEANREGGKIQNGKCIYCGDLIAPTKLLPNPVDLIKAREIWTQKAIIEIRLKQQKIKDRATQAALNNFGECIYFISDKPGYLVKIGFTTQLGKRLFRINQENPGCILLGAMPGTYQDEQIIHKMFYQFRQEDNCYTNYTEWFFLSKPIRFFIEHFCKNAVIEL